MKKNEITRNNTVATNVRGFSNLQHAAGNLNFLAVTCAYKSHVKSP